MVKVRQEVVVIQRTLSFLVATVLFLSASSARAQDHSHRLSWEAAVQAEFGQSKPAPAALMRLVDRLARSQDEAGRLGDPIGVARVLLQSGPNLGEARAMAEEAARLATSKDAAPFWRELVTEEWFIALGKAPVSGEVYPRLFVSGPALNKSGEVVILEREPQYTVQFIEYLDPREATRLGISEIRVQCSLTVMSAGENGQALERTDSFELAMLPGAKSWREERLTAVLANFEKAKLVMVYTPVTATGEALPSISRTYHFKLKERYFENTGGRRSMMYAPPETINRSGTGPGDIAWKLRSMYDDAAKGIDPEIPAVPPPDAARNNAG